MLGNHSNDERADRRSGRFFSTDDLPSCEQLETGRQHHADIVDLPRAGEPIDVFPARTACWEIGDLIFTHAVIEQGPERALGLVPEASRDHWRLVLIRQHRAADVLAFDGNGLTSRLSEQRLSTSALSFRSSAAPLKGGRKGDEVFTLLLPRAALPQLAQEFGNAFNPDVSPAMQGLLGDYLARLARALPLVSSEQARILAGPTTELVAACVTPTSARINAPLIDRATSVIRQNMASPDFGPDQLCQLLAMSRSKLYRFFEAFGGVASYIQRERLCAALVRLEHPDPVQPIHQIAAAVGFHDHSTFSRAFRREFGLSPSAVRKKA